MNFREDLEGIVEAAHGRNSQADTAHRSDVGFEAVVYDFMIALRYILKDEPRKIMDNAIEDVSVRDLDTWRRFSSRCESVFRSAQHDVVDMHALSNPLVARTAREVLGLIESCEYAVRQLGPQSQQCYWHEPNRMSIVQSMCSKELRDHLEDKGYITYADMYAEVVRKCSVGHARKAATSSASPMDVSILGSQLEAYGEGSDESLQQPQLDTVGSEPWGGKGGKPWGKGKGKGKGKGGNKGGNGEACGGQAQGKSAPQCSNFRYVFSYTYTTPEHTRRYHFV